MKNRVINDEIHTAINTGFYAIVITGILLLNTQARADHALGVQAGPIVQMQAKVDNVDAHFEFRGQMARLRYEFRQPANNLAAGGYIQAIRVENTYEDPNDPDAKESIAANGVGLHLGYLIGSAGSVDLGLGYQPAQIKKEFTATDEGKSETLHTYVSGFNFNFGLTIAPRLGTLAIPLRMQLDMTSITGGSTDDDKNAVMRPITFVSKTFLVGLDLLY